MGEIKSALEIALEKTAGIKSDKIGGDNRELKKIGKKAAGDYLGNGDIKILEETFKKQSPEKLKMIKEGALSVFLAGVRLPAEASDLEKIRILGKGFDYLLPKNGIKELFEQVDQILHHYLEERENLEKTLEQQFLPRLKAKQAEYQKRYGQTIPMELHQDNEFMSALTKNKRMIETKYETVVDEIRSRIREIAGIEE